MDTYLVQFVVTLEITRKLSSPYHLFGLKKQFPSAFRLAVGCYDSKDGCLGGKECPCRQAFGQELSTDPSLLRRHQKPPTPFLFDILPLQGGAKAGSRVEVKLLLAGSAATASVRIYLESLLHLFGDNPIFAVKGVKLSKIEALSLDSSRSFIGDSSGKLELSAIPVAGFDEFLSASTGISSSITLLFSTPLRLMSAGSPLREIPFAPLAGSLFRRISSIASYYGGVELDHDFKWLADMSREIRCSSSALEWVNWGSGLQGLIGEATYKGDLTGFIPFLKLGELLHAGKGASYGMGRYKILR